jgi:hypothetical protein
MNLTVSRDVCTEVDGGCSFLRVCCGKVGWFLSLDGPGLIGATSNVFNDEVWYL